jgi:hypothetical protein
MKYVSITDVDQYFKMSSMAAEQLKDVDKSLLVNMINFFAQGAVSTVSNYIYDAIHESEHHGVHLTHGMSKGCRCGSCYEWQLVDEKDIVIDTCEAFDEWVEREQCKGK